MFEKLWTVYPKKEGKSAALTAFNKLEVTGEDVDILIPCLLRFKAMWESQGRERKHIPSMGPWLNSDPLSADIPEDPEAKRKREHQELIEHRRKMGVTNEEFLQ
jgi:hypothetical protein